MGSYDVTHHKLSTIAENLKNDENVCESLEEVLKLRPSHELLKKYQIKEISSRYLSDPDSCKLAKSVKHMIKEQKKIKKELKRESKREMYEEEPQAESSSKINCSPPPADTRKRKSDELMKPPSKKKAPKVEVVPFDLSEELFGSSSSNDDRRKNREKAISKMSRDEQYNHDDFYQPPEAIVKQKVVPVVTEKPFNEEQMFKPRKDVRKVFAGRKKNTQTSVPTLLKASQTILIQYPNLLLKNVGWVEFPLIEPALRRTTPFQLNQFRLMNPNFELEVDAIFKSFVTKEFPGEDKLPKSSKCWADFYQFLVDRKERLEKIKLEKFKEKIRDKTNKKTDVSSKTMLIDEAHTPRHIRQRQERNGLAYSMKSTPSAKELSDARKAVGSGDRTKLASMPSAVVNRNSRVGASTGQKKQPPTTGYLMKKTMKMLNIKRR